MVHQLHSERDVYVYLAQRLLPDRYRNDRNDKFASESRFGLLVGYEGCDGYRIWDAGRRDIVRTCNVTFE